MSGNLFNDPRMYNPESVLENETDNILLNFEA